MGREVRMVPKDWQHPKKDDGSFKPQYGRSWKKEHAEWVAGFIKWQTAPESDCTYSQWCGGEPDPEYYMPDFPEGTATHYMMYEDTSEGTPISPAFATPEELARWLADTGASAFARMTASYDDWLATIRRGSACSMILTNNENGVKIQSGVEARS